MEKVTLVFATDSINGKQMIGVAKTVDSAIKLIKKSGYAYAITDEQLAMLALLNYTTNLEINFKLETWEVH
jgi:hypothetical protein